MRNQKTTTSTRVARTLGARYDFIPLKRLILLFICIIAGGCAGGGRTVPLSQFVDDLQAQIRQTSPLTRLSIAQIASGDGHYTQIIVDEQNRQCSSDPTLLLLGKDLDFNLKATIGGEGGLTVTQSVPAASVKISGSSEHSLAYRVRPLSLGTLPDIAFQVHIEIIKTLKDIKGTVAQHAVDQYLADAVRQRQELIKVSQLLLQNWHKPANCP